jgi:hypothetical protein
LNQIACVEGLFDRLGIMPTAATRKLCGQIINERQHRKERAGNPTTMQECRKRLAEYVGKAKERGIRIPASVGL